VERGTVRHVVHKMLRYIVEREILKHVVHKLLRYIVERETPRQVVHTVLRYIVERETPRHVELYVPRVLVSHVPQYILKLCVLRVLVSHVLQYILKLCVLRFFRFNLKTKHVDFIHSLACQCHVYYTKYYNATCNAVNTHLFKTRNFSHSWKKSQIFNRDTCKNLLVLLSHVPQYILKLCVLRVLVSLKLCVHTVLRYIVERETPRHVVHTVFRYIAERETLSHVVHNALRYYLKTCV
jgi:hypothetical protein